MNSSGVILLQKTEEIVKKLHEYYYSSRILTGPRRAESPISGIEARDRILAFIHRQKGLENVRLISSASEVGVRETYRVVGEKTINVLEPSRLELCSQKVSAICWSPAAPSQVTTARSSGHSHRPDKKTAD